MNPRAVTRGVAALAFLGPFDHAADRPFAFVLGVAQDHPKLRHCGREFQVRRRVLELRTVIDEHSLGQFARVTLRFLSPNGVT
jgi:hypothetical protein